MTDYEISKVREKAEVLARIEQQLAYCAYGSVPTDPEKRVQSDVKYKILKDAMYRALREYEEAIKGLSAEQLAEIAREASK